MSTTPRTSCRGKLSTTLSDFQAGTKKLPRVCDRGSRKLFPANLALRSCAPPLLCGRGPDRVLARRDLLTLCIVCSLSLCVVLLQLFCCVYRATWIVLRDVLTLCIVPMSDGGWGVEVHHHMESTQPTPRMFAGASSCALV